MFKFFQKLEVVGEGKRVMVFCSHKTHFDSWFRDLFFKKSITHNNIIFHRDATYVPIIRSSFIDSNYDHIIHLDDTGKIICPFI